ncbi:MAG: S1C family serine protease [Pirellulaceae bacterium]
MVHRAMVRGTLVHRAMVRGVGVREKVLRRGGGVRRRWRGLALSFLVITAFSGRTIPCHLWAEETVTAAPVALADAVNIDLKAIERQAQETLGRVMPAVVSVAGGSGVVISADGYVLTVAHVGMRAGRRVTITFPDGRTVRGKTLGNDEGVDAGLIKIEGDGPFPFVPMGKSADVKAGTWCLALGYPVSFERGKPPALRIGRVQRNRATALITDCTIMGGDSGGPLFDLASNLIGIGSRCDDELNINIHVPVDCYQNTWDRLVKGEDFNSLHRVRPYLGVGRSDQSDDPRVGRVYAGSSAEQAGIQVGDELVRFDGVEIARYSQLPPLIERRKPGDQVEIEVRRGESLLKLQVKLGQVEN